jgi:hypothetical protein
MYIYTHLGWWVSEVFPYMGSLPIYGKTSHIWETLAITTRAIWVAAAAAAAAVVATVAADAAVD